MRTRVICEYICIIAGSFLYAVFTCLFIFPSNILLGGTSGISVILHHFLPISEGRILSVINISLLLAALIVLGREMALKTFVGTMATTVFISLLDLASLGRECVIHSVYLSAVVGAAMIAVASAILFYVDSSSGGTDIIALMIRKYSTMNIGHALLLTDILIVIAGGLLLDIHTAAASMIGLLIKTQGINLVLYLLKKWKRG